MKAVIFHGWGASSSDNWFPWLRAQLEEKSIKVYCPDLPNSQHPSEEEWLNAAIRLTEYDEDTILIGHSLGCILIMRLLERLQKQVKAVFLIAGFDNNLGIEELKSFFRSGFNYWKIKYSSKKKIVMISSDDDHFIPLDVSKRTSVKIGAKLIVYKNQGHLSAGTDNGKFPELLDMVLHETD